MHALICNNGVKVNDHIYNWERKKQEGIWRSGLSLPQAQCHCHYHEYEEIESNCVWLHTGLYYYYCYYYYFDRASAMLYQAHMSVTTKIHDEILLLLLMWTCVPTHMYSSRNC